MANGCSNKGNTNEEITNLSNYCRVKCNLLYEFQICLKLENIKRVLEFCLHLLKDQKQLMTGETNKNEREEKRGTRKHSRDSPGIQS